MKKTYFVRRDNEGKIFDRGFMIEGQDEKELQIAAKCFDKAYPELVTFIDGVITVHYVKNTLVSDIKTFKSIFNMNYDKIKKYVTEKLNTEPAASTEKALTITRYNEGKGKHYDFVRVTGGSVKEYRKARTMARENLMYTGVIEGFDYIDFYGVTVEAVKRAIEPAPAKKVRRRNRQIIKAMAKCYGNKHAKLQLFGKGKLSTHKNYRGYCRSYTAYKDYKKGGYLPKTLVTKYFPSVA